MTTWPVSDLFQIQVDEVTLERVEEFVLLGSRISCNCDATTAIKHRVERAWKYFWANKSLFQNYDASLRKRLSLWYKTCARSLIWGLETVTMTLPQMRLLEREALQMVAKMMGLRRRIWEDESWVSWAIRRMRSARWIMTTNNEGGFIEFYLLQHFRWMGHLARMSEDRWAYRAASWLSLRWKEEGAINKNWNAYFSQFRWKLRGVGGTNKYTFAGLLQHWAQNSGNCNWWMLARDRDQWKESEASFVEMTTAIHRPSEYADLDHVHQSFANPWHAHVLS